MYLNINNGHLVRVMYAVSMIANVTEMTVAVH